MKPATLWLGLGALAGIALAAGSLLVGGGDATPTAMATQADVVALVNGRPIARETLARFAQTVARERGRLDVDPAAQRQMLERLIDEELLLQRGLDLGLARSEPGVRRAIVTAVIDTLTTEDVREPTREDLAQLLQSEPQRFERPGRVTVEAAHVPLGFPTPQEAPRRAAEVARRAQAGESLGVIAMEIAQPIEPALPVGPVALGVLRDRVGSIVTDAIAKMTPGEISEPIRAMDGWWVVALLAREQGVAPTVEQIEGPLRDEWLRREHDRKLDEAIAALRAEAEIQIQLDAAPTTPPGT
jgi:hypothetical protein